MNITKCTLRSVSSRMKSCFLFDRMSICGNVRSIPKAWHSAISPLCSMRNPSSPHCRYRTPFCHCNTTRFYSQAFPDGNSASAQTNAACEGEEQDRDIGISPRSSQCFNLDVMVSLLRQENAVDICVIQAAAHVQYIQYFVVVSGISPRHLRAMAQYMVKVHKFLKKENDPHAKVGGKNSDDWMCVDFGSMVVHVMLPQTRDVYELEKLWTLGRYDEQLMAMPEEKLPEDFTFDLEISK